MDANYEWDDDVTFTITVTEPGKHREYKCGSFGEGINTLGALETLGEMKDNTVRFEKDGKRFETMEELHDHLTEKRHELYRVADDTNSWEVVNVRDQVSQWMVDLNEVNPDGIQKVPVNLTRTAKELGYEPVGWVSNPTDADMRIWFETRDK